MIAGSVAVLAAALGGLMQGITPMAPQGRTGGAAPPLDVIGMAISAILAVLSGWGIWTAVAVFRRRGWARAFMLIFASLAALIGAGGGLAILFEPASAHAGHGMEALREAAGALCGDNCSQRGYRPDHWSGLPTATWIRRSYPPG